MNRFSSVGSKNGDGLIGYGLGESIYIYPKKKLEVLFPPPPFVENSWCTYRQTLVLLYYSFIHPFVSYPVNVDSRIEREKKSCYFTPWGFFLYTHVCMYLTPSLKKEKTEREQRYSRQK